MCVCYLALNENSQFPLILLFNRDEFTARPAEFAHFWQGGNFAAGRDIPSQGTWLAVGPHGKFAALTHFRDPKSHRPGLLSRGSIVPEFLQGKAGALEFMAQLDARATSFNGFNLLAGDSTECFYYSNRSHELRKLEPGIFALSNATLDTPWPKVTRGKNLLQHVLTARMNICSGQLFEAALLESELLEILHDNTPGEDADLPNTGIGQAHEKALSPIFIAAPAYGTRSSSVLLRDAGGRTTLVERTFDPAGEGKFQDTHLSF